MYTTTDQRRSAAFYGASGVFEKHNHGGGLTWQIEDNKIARAQSRCSRSGA
jgi:hypothetical protein